MKFAVRTLALTFSLSFTACLLSIAPTLAHAGETITYPGATLRDNPFGTPNALFPSLTSLSGNTVTVNSGTVGGYVYGGVTTGADMVRDNRVFINGGTVNRYVYGGYSGSGGNANYNTVTITGGTVDSIYGGLSSGGNANYNTVTITGGTVDSVYGGESSSSSSNANYNTVTITGGTVNENVTGGSSGGGGGNTNYNTVTITGGTVNENVTGGSSGGGNNNANYNTVTITGGTVNGDVYGGFSSGNATYNTVTIGSGATLANSSSLYGGRGGGGADQFTGNTLNLLGWQGAVAIVQNFQNLNFVLPASFVNGDTQLTVAGIANLTGSGSRSSTVNVGIMGGGRVQQVGESFTLIDAGTLTTDGSLNNTTVQGKKGVSLLYDFKLAAPVNTNPLTAEITGVSVNSQTKALAEGRAAGGAFLNQGSDNVLHNMSNALHAAQGSNTNMGSFGAVSGGDNRYNTGSHVNVDGVSLILGAASKKTLADNSHLLMGAFVEGGTGSYNSYNSFTNAASVNGKGDTDYIGLGALGRYTLPSNLYFEASVRTGRSKVDFNSHDLVSTTGQNASYSSNAWYYGMHGGVGYELLLNTVSTLDISGKLIWTHLGSDSVTVAGDPVRFESSDSLRSRLGARYNYTLNNQVTAYAGAAWEYEFDGKAKATTYGYNMDAPSVRGGTGVGELGISVKPEGNGNMSFDLAIQGYAGKREGGTGSVALRYKF